MSNLTGSRSRFKQDTNFELDQIVELYDIPTSKRKLVSEYQVLLSKDNPSSTELERLSILQNELSEYMITAEKWNFFGDVIVNIQRFFKSNVQDVVVQIKNDMLENLSTRKQEILDFITEKKQEITSYTNQKKQEVDTLVSSESGNITQLVQSKSQELTSLVIGKSDEITNLVNTKKQEINSLVTSESSKVTQLVGSKTEEITNLVSTKSSEITSHVGNKKQEIDQYADSTKQNVTQFVTQKTDQLSNTIAQKEEQFTQEMNKVEDRGEYNPSAQYYKKNFIRFEGNAYLCIKDALGKHPTNETYWLKLTIKGDAGYSVGLSPKGVYSVSTNYITNDLVNYNGNLYYAIKPSKGIFPSNVEYWGLFLAGNGEQLNDLQTEDKFSLVGAINENNQLIKRNKNTYDDYVETTNNAINEMSNNIRENTDKSTQAITSLTDIVPRVQRAESDISSTNTQIASIKSELSLKASEGHTHTLGEISDMFFPDEKVITLSVSGWDSNKTQTVNVSKINQNTWGILGIGKGSSLEQREAIRNASISIERVENNSITFVYDGDKPTMEITLRLLYLEQ